MRIVKVGVFAAFVLFSPAILVAGEESTAVVEYRALNLTKDPKAAAAGEYKLDPHHASVVAKLAHMDLSRYTLRFDDVKGRFSYDPANPTATAIEISIDPKSVDTGDQAFDKKIAERYFEAATYPTISFTSTAIRPDGDQGRVEGILDFHGVKKPVTLNIVYRGYTGLDGQGRMGFSGETSFKRSEFGVDGWIPLEADEVAILIETEFIKTP